MTVFQNNESLRHKLLEGLGEEDVPSRDFFNGLKLSISVRKSICQFYFFSDEAL